MSQSEAIYYGIPALSIFGSYIAYKFLLLPRDRTFLTKVSGVLLGPFNNDFIFSGKVPPKQSGLVWSIWFNNNFHASIDIFTFVRNICLGTNFKGITLESNQDFYPFLF